MVVLSCLRPATLGLKAVVPFLRCSPEIVSASKQAGHVVMSIRAGSGRAKVMRSGLFHARFDRDTMHFFFLLGFIPVATIAICTNLFVAPGELTDLPADHNPQTWEYHKHPITRFFAKYLVRSPEKLYETNMALIYDQEQKMKYRLLRKKVKHVMSERHNVRGWYFYQAATDTYQQSADVDAKPGTPF